MSYIYYTQTAGVVKIVNPPNPPFLDEWGLHPHTPVGGSAPYGPRGAAPTGYHTTHPRHPVNTGRRGIFYVVQEMKEGGLT